MKKLLLFALLMTATTLFAVDPRVETFDTKDGTKTSTYVTSPTTKECQQASWTVYAGGILPNLGNMGSTNYASVTRAKKDADTEYPYMVSSTIEGGIDSLWFEWNSNGGESGNWNMEIYVNDQLIGSITDAAGAAIAAGGPFNIFKKGGINVEGNFTIKVVNKSTHAGAQDKNSKRFVIDNLSWMPKPKAGEKTTPNLEFAENALIKKIDADPFTNTLTSTSDGTPTFESSKPAVATVDATGKVTIAGVGETTITASVAETETYKAAEASYTLRVVPLNFNMETFDGAQNVDLSTNNTYLTSPTESLAPSEATGLKWTTLLGSVRNSLGGSSSSNLAAVVRAKKTSEENFGYLLSSKISGGIDSLAFEWNANGTEASRTKNWDIDIYVNDTKVGSINDKGQAVQPAGSWFRFGVGGLKIDGDFTIKIVNNNVPDDGTGNQYRWVVDNIEWYSYTAPVYSVAGAEALLGSNWNEKEGNELAKQEDGTYKLVKEAVQLEAGNYEYKVVIDHKWNNGEAGENSVLNIAKAGKYDVIFTYDKNEPKTDAKAGLNAVYSLAGSSALFNGNNWNEKEGFELVKQADLTYKLVVENVELAKGSYEYKVVIDHKWDNGEVSQNSVLNIDKPGKYDITYTYDPFTITTAGEAELKEEIVILPEVDLAGQFNGWVQNDAMTPAEDKLTASISKTLTAGDYTFKVIVATGWRGNGQDFTRENNSVTGLTANGDNMTLKADRDGVYVFTWTYESDKLEITFPVADGLQNTGAERMVKKQIIDGQLIITVDGVQYDAQGVQR